MPGNCVAPVKTILDFSRAKREQHPIVMLAAYDALLARIVATTEADAILVGDSVAMVAHGFPSTLHATVDMMCTHVAAVRRGAPEIVVVADMPFLSVRRGVPAATDAAGALMQAGATAVKLEGVAGHEDVIAHLVESGIPVMGHLGLTPQSVHQLGGYRLQGRSPAEAERVRNEARRLEELGAFSLVLECVPAALAATITEERAIPTIGIGAGAGTAGQVLVLSDLLGLDARFQPRFARKYIEGHETVRDAINRFARDVRAAGFPAREEVLA
jgi:3-methyl-2-oxobutanoate hydroxymethyltransferase